MAKGVATLMDTVFLIMIAAAASAILFYSAGQYGKNLVYQADRLFLDYYARQIVRVLTTASIHPPGCEPDYFLAYLKEMAYRGKLNDPEVQKNLSDVIGKAMKPLENAYDYAVVFSLDNKNYMFIWYRSASSPNQMSCRCTLSDTEYVNWAEKLKGTVYSYSVPLNVKIQGGNTDVYVIMRMRVFIWPAGLNGAPTGCSCP